MVLRNTHSAEIDTDIVLQRQIISCKTHQYPIHGLRTLSINFFIALLLPFKFGIKMTNLCAILSI